MKSTIHRVFAICLLLPGCDSGAERFEYREGGSSGSGTGWPATSGSGATGFEETGLEETGLEETGLEETGGAETGGAETGLEETGGAEDDNGSPGEACAEHVPVVVEVEAVGVVGDDLEPDFIPDDCTLPVAAEEDEDEGPSDETTAPVDLGVQEEAPARVLQLRNTSSKDLVIKLLLAVRVKGLTAFTIYEVEVPAGRTHTQVLPENVLIPSMGWNKSDKVTGKEITGKQRFKYKVGGDETTKLLPVIGAVIDDK